MYKNLFATASLLAVLAACGQKDAAQEVSEAAQNIAKVAEPAAIVIAKGNPANAEAALKILSLADTGIVQFADKTVSGANATYENISIAEVGEFGLSAAKLSLEGLDASGEVASFGRLLVSDLSVDIGDEDGGLDIGSFEIINPSDEFAAFISDITDNGSVDGEMPNFVKLGFDRLLVSNVSVAPPADEFSGSISLGSFGINSNSADTIGAISISGLDVSGTSDEGPIAISLGSVVLGGLQKSKFEKLGDLVNSERTSLAASFGEMFGSPENIVEPGYDNFSMNDVGVEVNGLAISVADMNIVNSRFDGGGIKSSVLKPTEVSIVPSGDSPVAAQLRQAIQVLGLEKLDFVVATATNIAADQDALSLKTGENYFGVKDFATFNFGGNYSGIKAVAAKMADFSPEALENDPESVLDLYSPLAFQAIELQLQNNGGIQTLLNMAAAQRGMDLQSMIEEAKGMSAVVPMMAASQGIDAALASEVVNAGLSFMENPKTLKLSFKPVEALTVNSFDSQEKLLGLTKESLGFSAVNE